MRIKPTSRRAVPGKLLGSLLPVIVVLGALGVGAYWWQSPARKIQGEWDLSMGGGLMPIRSTITFKGGFLRSSGTFTSTTALGGGALSLSSGENGGYALDSGTNPPTLTLTTMVNDRKPVAPGSLKGATMGCRFVDGDTIELEPKDGLPIKLELKRKK